MSPELRPEDVRFFATADAFREWLRRNHDRATDVWIGFHRTRFGRGGLTYRDAVDQALCFGWIDGIRKTLDAERYANRFTPRKRGSTWSLVNVRRAEELVERGLMETAGLRAFRERDERRSGRYSYENRPARLSGPYERELRANPTAWEFFRAQPPGYRRTATWWVMDAKREETRRRRLATLVEVSAAGRRLPQLARPVREEPPAR
jgi:uncharacterized protein YdeI (YjbR/CyaY-like superfamily)